MKRILFLIGRLCYRIPGWLLKIHSYNKNKDKVSFEERFHYVRQIILKINQKSRVKIHTYGIENLPQKQGYLMTPNHQGLFDALIMFESNDKPFVAVVKKELMSVFVLSSILRVIDFLAIDRDNLRASVKVIREVTQGLKEGMNYMIFPEGTRCRKENQMLDFKGGTFKSAMDAQCPIVPIALIDCYKVFDNNTIAVVDAQIHYLEAIGYDEYKDMNSTELAKLVQERIRICVEENEDKFN